jgi:uncharacterized protein YeaO (DUF488 family)
VDIRIKRAYDVPSPSDGTRILVDRLWPRGLTREKAAIEEWLKDVAPTTALRSWFQHDRSKWREFARLYRKELEDNPVPVQRLRLMARAGTLTLVFSALDAEHNQAVVLRDFLLNP